RSLYERSADGFFWIAFYRYVFSFDPNRPEEVAVKYEVGVSEMVATPAAAFQRQERNVYESSRLSDIPFPTTILEKRGRLVLGGIDGFALDTGQVSIKVAINADSLRFVSLFLPYILKLDSLFYDGNPVDFHRRHDFDFVGVVLPEYCYRGDTVDFTFWYHGKKYDLFLPYVEDPRPCLHDFIFVVPASYSYYVSGMGEMQFEDGGRKTFEVKSSNQYREFYFHAYASDIDTIPLKTSSGIPLNVLRSRHLSKRMLTGCFVPDEKFRESVVGAFNHMTSYLGRPINTFVEYVVPERHRSMPGLIMVPQTSCAMEAPLATLGDFDLVAGIEVGKQWFGSLMRPAGDRECWLTEAAPRFLGLLHVQNKQGPVYLGNLIVRRDSLYKEIDRGHDMPLAAGSRVNTTILRNKGIWLLHMLRFHMFDPETQSESKFLRFLLELAILCNTKTYTNSDIQTLAEKHYGADLGWFFDQWLYGRNLPEFDVEYRFESSGDGYTVRVAVETKGAPEQFSTPVIMRVSFADGSREHFRETAAATETEFTLGPFDKEPQEFFFNEFLGVLSRDKVKKR
ncbi:MAG: hypothetical protein AB1744_11490, partial [Candidatus Zixiibacteriota bacterium]